LNPQKLAGQCGKLKCCLNYELDAYIDAQKDFPPTDVPLETETETYYHFKTDIFKRLMWFSTGRDSTGNVVMLSVDKVKEIIELNKQGRKVPRLASENVSSAVVSETDYTNVIGEDSITRFDEQNKKPAKKKKSKQRKSSFKSKSGNAVNQNKKRSKNRSSNASGDNEN
jgi:hypothetical protein